MAYTLKWLLGRPRPALYPLLVELPLSDAFPSAHTAQATAFFIVLAVIVRRNAPEWAATVAVLSALAILGVALSRIYLQVHFPSDVLGGFVLAVVWLAVTGEALRRFGNTYRIEW
jgi:undecaprenyl-diphosphatase